MFVEPDTRHYHALQARLSELHKAPVRDWTAIDAVMAAIEAEQLRLKSLDGQHGNNPIEWRHRDPPRQA